MRRRLFPLALPAVPALVIAGPPARYRFTSFDVPGSTPTRGLGINHAGALAVGGIVGRWDDAAGHAHGY